MLVGSYISGSLPLTTKLSDRKIRFLNALGAGLLIGTSLIVVIPEGVETIYGKKRAPSEQQQEEEEKEKSHIAIGLSLLLGFALMFIIDQTSSLHMPSSTGGNSTAEYSELNTLGSNSFDPDEGDVSNRNNNVSHHTSMTPTVGLIVHAAADGIALGASANHPELSLVVFLAIMLHKAPASFALTSVLLASGLAHNTIRKHLLGFALAAPLGALLTHFALYFFSSSTSNNLEYWTGVLLVFSGGTFLYVAMHALQEVSHDNHSKDKTQMFIILIGMAIPTLLSLSHSH
ncbi:Zinc/iron permease [Cokeromyces recurvatus]|uniref:Zinc/iron permease n=1 Tax=Cokeromyces recurvatus TaxID=90255 RepID=UPI00221EC0B0|nr:Zinc/iron permease [Cokeromyces recurvatus]KAI7907239.1 Zinc/iron permease [Cokeromyces recurvatus]